MWDGQQAGPLLGVLRRSQTSNVTAPLPAPPPTNELTGSESIPGTSSGKSGVDMTRPYSPSSSDAPASCVDDSSSRGMGWPRRDCDIRAMVRDGNIRGIGWRRGHFILASTNCQATFNYHKRNKKSAQRDANTARWLY